LAGRAGNPAQIVDAPTGPGWQIQIDGAIDARHFVLEGIGPSGVHFGSGAAFGAPPMDFRLGLLRRCSGGPLLAIERAPGAPVLSLRYLTFEDRAPRPLYNVNAAAVFPPPSTRIRMVNAAGPFAGQMYEHDPNNVVAWVSATTTLRYFRAAPRLGRIDLRFATTAENDDGVFQIARALSPDGPFTDILAPITPQGAGNGFTYPVQRDTAVQAPTRYYYRLEQVLPHGPRLLLGTAAARPLPQAIGIAAFVGPGGFADIPSAIAAVGPRGYVVVAPGTYPSLSINQPIHLMSDGSGLVTIDTSTGPLTITGIPYAAGNDVALYDIKIGPGASAGIVIDSCGCPVLLDGCEVTTTGAVDSVLVHESPGVEPLGGVALQGCTLRVGLVRVRGSKVYIAAGAIDALRAESSATPRPSTVVYAGSPSAPPTTRRRR
jgi:hypothetical protein